MMLALDDSTVQRTVKDVWGKATPDILPLVNLRIMRHSEANVAVSNFLAGASR